MLKKVLSLATLVFVMHLPLAAHWVCWGQKYCWGWARYVDPYCSSEDGLYYGYVDNINYPNTYGLPLNCQFNYCPPCRANNVNCTYMQNCIEYSTNRRCPPPQP